MAQRVTRVRDILPLIPKGTKVFVFRGSEDITPPKDSLVRKLLAIFNVGKEQEEVMAAKVQMILPYTNGIEIRVYEGRRRT